MAMNGWADAEPAWWLNLQAHPDVTVDLPGGSRAVHARAADPGVGGGQTRAKRNAVAKSLSRQTPRRPKAGAVIGGATHHH